MANIESLANALNGRPKPGGGWLAHCPAHDDRHPSLSIDVGDNGSPLLKCFSGCTQEAVIDELKTRGLWHDGQGKAASEEELKQARQRLEQGQAERQEKYANTAVTAQSVWKAASPARQDHPYFLRKQVQPTDTLREIDLDKLMELTDYHPHAKGEPLAAGRVLVVPVVIDGKISTIEMIDEDGRKSALTFGRKKDGYWMTQPVPEDDGERLRLLIGEGVATCLSVKEATGLPAIAALSCSNLLSVARQMRERFPSAEITILADLIKKTGAPDPHAVEASKEIMGILAVPDFGPDRQENLTDFNDICVTMGVDAVSKNIDAAFIRYSDADNILDIIENKPTSLSPSSLSTSYPAFESTSGVHFDDALLIFDNNSRPKLVPQSIAAQKIGEEIKTRFAFCGEALAWYRFDNTCWRFCPTSHKAESEVTNLIYQGAGETGFSSTYNKGAFDLLKKSRSIRLPERLTDVIPFQNGLLELSTGKLIPTTPANAATWVLPCDFIEEAGCPNFLEWLNVAVDGDQDTIQLLRGWINAVLIGRPYLQIFLHIIGPAGTGKSTFGRLIFKIVGTENATTTTMKHLETNRFEAASVYGKRIVAIEEADKYGGSVSVFKSMTGQDPLRLERKNQQQQGSFVYGGQTLLTSNERIMTSDNTSGIERRRITVEFTHRTTVAERIDWHGRGGEAGILYKEIPGIINWALKLSNQEVDELFKNIPDRVRRSNLGAARTNNPMIDWMLKNLIPSPNSSTQVGVKQEVRNDGEVTFKDSENRLYPNYLTWCRENGREALSLQRFTSVLTEAAESYGISIKKKREKDGVKVFGLRLRMPEEDSWLGKLEGEDLEQPEVKDNHLIMQNMKEMNDTSLTSDINLGRDLFTNRQMMIEEDLEVIINEND